MPVCTGQTGCDWGYAARLPSQRTKPLIKGRLTNHSMMFWRTPNGQLMRGKMVSSSNSKMPGKQDSSCGKRARKTMSTRAPEAEKMEPSLRVTTTGLFEGVLSDMVGPPCIKICKPLIV